MRYPGDTAEALDVRVSLSSARLSYCVFTEESGGRGHFLESRWLDGSVEDLQTWRGWCLSPSRAVERASNTLQEGIDRDAQGIILYWIIAKYHEVVKLARYLSHHPRQCPIRYQTGAMLRDRPIPPAQDPRGRIRAICMWQTPGLRKRPILQHWYRRP